MLALCGLGRLRRHLPLGRHRLDHPHRQRAGPRHGRERPVGQRRAGALRHRAGRADHARLVARRLHRARHRLPGRGRGARLADQAGPGRRPADARRRRASSPGAREFWRVFSVLSVTMALEGIIWRRRDVRRSPGVRDAACRRHRGAARGSRLVGRGHPGRAVGRPRDLDDLRRFGHRPVRHGPAHHRPLSAEVDLCHGLGAAGRRHAGAGHGQWLRGARSAPSPRRC